jgi:hypothetical protein
VKYMLMIYNNPATMQEMTDQERNGILTQVDMIMKELTESGELVGGEALADPSTAKTVRVRGGVETATDGPFAEAKEQLAGYLTVECETEARAIEIAARWPDAQYCAMEVRAVLDMAGMEM